MKKQRILVPADYRLIPPESVQGVDLEDQVWKTEYYVISELRKLGHEVMPLAVNEDFNVVSAAIFEFKPNIVYNLLEDFAGEVTFDHNIISYYELNRISYTGCNPKGLMLAKDKSLSKQIVSHYGIQTPHFMVAPKGRKFQRPSSMDFPLIVKSLTEEGSLGICQNSIVKNDEKLQERIDYIHESIGSDAIIESYIEGVDLYVSVLGNKQLSIFPILELKFKEAPERIYQIASDKVKWSKKYRNKYKIDFAFTKRFDDHETKKIEHMSRSIYHALHLSGYARLDFRLTPDNQLYFIEANPNPDIAKDGEFAASAEKGGISYGELLNKIISLGLGVHLI